jgi:hypothetical protein
MDTANQWGPGAFIDDSISVAEQLEHPTRGFIIHAKLAIEETRNTEELNWTLDILRRDLGRWRKEHPDCDEPAVLAAVPELARYLESHPFE